MSARTPFEALRSALRFAASRSCITSAEELAIMDAWNNTRPQPSAEPVAWMYHYPGAETFAEVRLYEGMSCQEEDEGMIETPLYPASALEAARRDALEEADRRLKFLQDESYDLRCFSVPTGGDDADIGWRVVGHWQAKPHERTIAEVYHDDPGAAIDAAMALTCEELHAISHANAPTALKDTPNAG